CSCTLSRFSSCSGTCPRAQTGVSQPPATVREAAAPAPPLILSAPLRPVWKILLIWRLPLDFGQNSGVTSKTSSVALQRRKVDVAAQERVPQASRSPRARPAVELIVPGKLGRLWPSPYR